MLCDHADEVDSTAGNFPERLCQPMADYITSRGGEIHLNKRLREIVTNEDGTVSHYALTDGSKQEADLYISAMSGGSSFLQLNLLDNPGRCQPPQRLGCVVRMQHKHQFPATFRLERDIAWLRL